MAVNKGITDFDQWYGSYRVNPNTNILEYAGSLSEECQHLIGRYDYYRREMGTRVANYHKYEKQASAEVVSIKEGMPNISSGDSAGYIERIAKNVIQNTPNVEIVSKFDDDSVAGRLANYFLKNKIIGDDEYSNDMQQNLRASTEIALTLGFDCVIPVLQQQANGAWYIQYDNINYRDVFPEPGAKDVRRANDVFVRRYLTKGDIKALIRDSVPGWDHSALRRLLETSPASREYTDKESEKHRVNPEAYEVVTWYSNSGENFVTFDAREHLLLRIEKNKHPLKEHPVFFLILKRDPFQPLGKSVLAKTYGRQEFQDMFFNGSMKMFARNIDPPIFGYGTVNSIPNLAPGKYTQISNPNAKVEAFEVNTQALMMFSQIASLNTANISTLMGASDQQMASQSTGGMMSQTPQGVEAQQAMVDITTNDYQKAVEAFLSKYLSYALTIYFQELKNVKKLTPSADARQALIGAGMLPEAFDEDGAITTPLKDLAIQYWVKIVPGTLVEIEDEKQIRLLNQMFIPLSQAMPALAASGDPSSLQKAAAAMEYIIQKQIALSGSNSAKELEELLKNGSTDEFKSLQKRQEDLEKILGGEYSDPAVQVELTNSVLVQQREQIQLLQQGMAALGSALGIQVPTGSPAAPPPGPAPVAGGQPGSPGAPGPGAGKTAPRAPEPQYS